MSPVSPVCHTEATVSIGLKNVSRVGTSFNLIVIAMPVPCCGLCPMLKTLIHIIMENRNRRASGPVHSFTLIPLHKYEIKLEKMKTGNYLTCQECPELNNGMVL